MYLAHGEYWPLGIMAALWVAAEWVVYKRAVRWVPELVDVAQTSGWRPGIKFAFRAGAAAMLFVTALGPSVRGWTLSTGKPERDLYLIMDVSRGMLTEDVPGGRWRLAQTLADSVISQADVDHVGIIAFASMPYVQCPMTADKPLAQKYLRMLHPKQFVNSGTNFRKALLMLLSRMESEGLPNRALSVVVFSDGEFEQDDNHSLYKRLKASGATLIPVGIGTAGGGVVPDESGKAFLDNEGMPAVSRLVPKTMEAMGKFFGTHTIFFTDRAPLAPVIEAIAETPVKNSPAGSGESENIYPFFLLIGIGCLFASYLATPARKS